MRQCYFIQRLGHPLFLFTYLTLSAEDDTNDDDGAKAVATDATVASTANIE